MRACLGYWDIGVGKVDCVTCGIHTPCWRVSAWRENADGTADSKFTTDFTPDEIGINAIIELIGAYADEFASKPKEVASLPSEIHARLVHAKLASEGGASGEISGEASGKVADEASDEASGVVEL